MISFCMVFGMLLVELWFLELTVLCVCDVGGSNHLSHCAGVRVGWAVAWCLFNLRAHFTHECTSAVDVAKLRFFVVHALGHLGTDAWLVLCTCARGYFRAGVWLGVCI